MGNASSRSAKRHRGGDRSRICKQGRFNSTLPQLLPFLHCRDTASLAQASRGSNAIIGPRLQELLHMHASQLVQEEEERSLTSEFCFDPPIFASLVSALLPSGETVLTRQAVWVLHNFVEGYVLYFLAHASRVASARSRLVQSAAAESTPASPARAASSQLHLCGAVSETEVTDDDEDNSAATTAVVPVITPHTSPEKDAGGRRSSRTHAATTSGSVVTQRVLSVPLWHADVEIVQNFVGFDCGGGEEWKGTAGGGTAGNGRSVLLEQGLRRLALRAKVAYVGPGVLDRLAEVVVRLVRTEVEAVVCSVSIGEEDDDWGSDSSSERVVVDAVEHDSRPSLPLLLALSHAQTLYGGPLTLQPVSLTQCVAVTTRQAQGSADAPGLMSAYDFLELTESLSNRRCSLECFRPRVPFAATDARLLQSSMEEHLRAVLAAALAVSGGGNIERDHVRIACELLQVELEDVTAIARHESLKDISEKLKRRMKAGLTALARVTLSSQAADALLLHCVSLLGRVLYLHRVVAECLAAQLLEEDGEKLEGRVGDGGLASAFCERTWGEVIGTVSKQKGFDGEVAQEEEEDLLHVKAEDFNVQDGDVGDSADDDGSSRESSCDDGDMSDADDSDTEEPRTLPNKRHRMLQAAVVTEGAMRTSLASRWRRVGTQAVYGRLAENDVDNVYNSLVPTVVQRAMVWT